MDYEQFNVVQLNDAVDSIGEQIERLRERRRAIVAIRTRKLRTEHLTILMQSTGRDPAEMTFEQMEEVEARIKAGKVQSSQRRVSAGVAAAAGVAIQPNAG